MLLICISWISLGDYFWMRWERAWRQTCFRVIQIFDALPVLQITERIKFLGLIQSCLAKLHKKKQQKNHLTAALWTQC